jgi:ubiquitin-conjugating enzyme E2 variant
MAHQARGGRPRSQVCLEAVALATAGALLAALAARVAHGLTGAVEIAALLGGVAVGYLVADFFTGFAHWFGDSFFEEESPVIGPVLIQPFREHHRDPLAMTRHELLEIMGNSALILSPLLAAAWWYLGMTRWPGVLLGAALVTFAGAALLTNLFHRWAHAAPDVPAVVARLQAWGVILAPAHHARHHAPPHLVGYCVTSGWVNRWADAAGVFRALERLGGACGLPLTRDR